MKSSATSPPALILFFPQEPPQLFGHAVAVLHLALPDDQHLPSRCPKSPKILAITSRVAGAFLFPIGRIYRRPNSTGAACVNMPEAAVNEHDFSMTRKDNIWGTRQIGTMQTEPEAEPVDQRPHEQLRFRILLADTRHAVAALGGCQCRP